jgi:hypothetical protein
MVAVATPLPQDAIAAASIYISVFAGRDDAYSVWAGDHWRLAGRYEKVDGKVECVERWPLTPERIVESFMTGVPLSSYLISPDNTVPIAALDIDRDDGHQLGVKVLKHLTKLGGIGYIEGSRRGCHVWIPMSERRPAIMVRRALRALCAEAGLPMDKKRKSEWVPELNIELRPGSDRIRDGGVGHCIRMPTMPHQRTGTRYALFGSDGSRLPPKLTGMMLELDACPVDILDEAALRAPAPPVTSQPMDLRYPYGQPETVDSASHLLIELWGADPRAAPGKLIKCPAHDDEHPSLSILRDDERAICRSPSCILSNDDHGRGLWELRNMAPRGT